jgi:serine/threonine protein kinase
MAAAHTHPSCRDAELRDGNAGALHGVRKVSALPRSRTPSPRTTVPTRCENPHRRMRPAARPGCAADISRRKEKTSIESRPTCVKRPVHTSACERPPSSDAARDGLAPDTTARDPFAPGARIGPYHLIREIGRGGMGRVLLAHDLATGEREVALKVLLADTTHRPLLEARFQREIRNLARLRHRGIVTIFCAGSFAGHPYLVMDHLAGRDLREYLVEIAPLPETERLARVTRVLAEVARAVEHAHASGVVHRDIKPSNVRITHDGDTPVLLDFGISKCLDDLGLTGIEMPGTALYMAPEQVDVRLRASEHLIDVWALGVTLYVALTGRAPFAGDSALALSHDVLHTDPVPPSQINPEIPPVLEQAVLGCLVKDAHARVASAGALATLLDDALAVLAPPAGTPPANASARDARDTSSSATATATAVAVTHASLPLAEHVTVLDADADAAAPSALAETAWSAWPAAQDPVRARRDVVARVVLALACLVLLALTRDLRGIPSGRTADAADAGAAAARAEQGAGIAAEPQLRTMLADDDRLARSVLLYTSDLAGPSRRALLDALRALRQGRTEAALAALQTFVGDNPRSTLAPVARFWIATALLAGGHAQEARDAYEQIVATTPHSAVAPRALLLEASAARTLGDRDAHDRLLARLAADYPDSDAAHAATGPLPLA